MRYIFSMDGKLLGVTYERDDFIDPQAYESSENDPLAEREEARINKIVWGKKFHLKPTVVEGTFTRAD